MSVEANHGSDSGRCFVLRPNRSASWRTNKHFFLGCLFVTALIAGRFCVMGAYWVLPFAGLEMLALFAGLYVCSRKTYRREVIVVGQRAVSVEAGWNHPARREEFARPWVRVVLEFPAPGRRHSRLRVGTRGNDVEVGAFLNEPERLQLAGQLRRAVDH